ncbi:MAG: tetratricopeptide repeat-containing sulfotransferase family protein, partial [Sciscionella sp.]
IASLYQQATAAYANGHPAQAETLARRLIQLDPLHCDAHYLAGAIRLDAGDPATALPLLETAVQLNPIHPGVQHALANSHYALGHWQEAINYYDHLLQIGRADNLVFLNLAIALHIIQQTETAVQVLKQGTHSYPSDPALWNAYGDLLNKQGDDLTSIMAHEQAVTLMPDNPDYNANLALMYEQSNRMDDAKRLATEMLTKHPQHPLLLIIAARCARREKNYKPALALLNRIPTDTNLRFRRTSLFEAGRIHDHLEETEQAYECFIEGNKLTLEMWPNHRQDAAVILASWEMIHSYVASLSALPWPDFPPETNRPGHAFLLGFMRSGTTLMDTILETDPRITVLEEGQPIQNVIRYAESLAGGYPACLERLTAEQVRNMRNQYWQGVEELTGEPIAGKIVLDKQPVLGPHVGLVKLLFPSAQFIFALRHPCDVVLSCFMQPFGHNPFHANFLTLEHSAKVYALVMDLWLKYSELLDIKAHTLKYEKLVTDKQKTLAEVFEFLGLNDAETNIDHVSHAKQRGRIYTPSYHQVVQPLYTDAMERWRRYRDYFEPILPILRPYIDRFGYFI